MMNDEAIISFLKKLLRIQRIYLLWYIYLNRHCLHVWCLLDVETLPNGLYSDCSILFGRNSHNGHIDQTRHLHYLLIFDKYR